MHILIFGTLKERRRKVGKHQHNKIDRSNDVFEIKKKWHFSTCTSESVGPHFFGVFDGFMVVWFYFCMVGSRRSEYMYFNYSIVTYNNL